jgi:hypothetical protein
MSFEADLATEIAAGAGISLTKVAHEQLTAPSTVFRWVTRGLPGGDGTRVKLQAIKRGKKWITTVDAVKRFFAALPQSEPSNSTPSRTPRQRERDNNRAKQALQKIYGI